MARIRTVSNLREFFMNSVAAAMGRQQLDADAHTSHYVVNLLTLFARSEALFDETENGTELTPVAKVLATAADADELETRHRALQRVGDVSLFVAGFLGDGLTARLVDVDYYIKMGGGAYRALADCAGPTVRGRAFNAVFAELAEKFQDFVDVLAEVRDGSNPREIDVLRLYDSWLRTRSRRAARLLRSVGIEPTPPGGLERAH